MPKGVEHLRAWVEHREVALVRTSLMPKGVEHSDHLRLCARTVGMSELRGCRKAVSTLTFGKTGPSVLARSSLMRKGVGDMPPRRPPWPRFVVSTRLMPAAVE